MQKDKKLSMIKYIFMNKIKMKKKREIDTINFLFFEVFYLKLNFKFLKGRYLSFIDKNFKPLDPDSRFCIF